MMAEPTWLIPLIFICETPFTALLTSDLLCQSDLLVIQFQCKLRMEL